MRPSDGSRNPVGSTALAVLAVLAAVLTAGAAATHQRADIGKVSVHSATFEFALANDPRLFTVDCAPGEQLISGGYSVFDPAAHVAVSYPSTADGAPVASGERAAAWTVGVLNATRTLLRMQVFAVCLAGGDGRSTVRVTTDTRSENAYSLAADCPQGTVRTGGGYSSVWARSLGTAAVTGSYPGPEGRWGIDVATLPGDPDVRARATVSVYAVCLSGAVQVARPSPTRLDLLVASPVCTANDPVFAAACARPVSGTAGMRCETDGILASGGYQVVTGALPGSYAVMSNAPAAGQVWNLAVRGSSTSAAPVGIRLTPVCLVPVAGQVTATTEVAPTKTGTGDTILTGGGRNWPLFAGIAVFLLVLVALLLAFWLGRRGRAPHRDRRPAVDVRLEVLPRARRSRYRPHEFREIP